MFVYVHHYGGYVSSESGSLRQLATRLPDLPSIEVSAQAPVLAPLVCEGPDGHLHLIYHIGQLSYCTVSPKIHFESSSTTVLYVLLRRRSIPVSIGSSSSSSSILSHRSREQ